MRQGQSPQTMHHPFQTLTSLCLVAGVTAGSGSPHTPLNNSWVVTYPETGYRAVLAQRVGPLGTSWFPPLSFDLCQLAEHSWHRTQPWKGEVGAQGRLCRYGTFYVCPGGKRTTQCRGAEAYFCASWGCEMSFGAYLNENKWRVSKSDLIRLDRSQNGSESVIFTDTRKQETGWEAGKLWGLRIYVAGGSNPGLLFSLRLVSEPTSLPTGIGTN